MPFAEIIPEQISLIRRTMLGALATAAATLPAVVADRTGRVRAAERSGGRQGADIVNAG